jgi:hypothetical protein
MANCWFQRGSVGCLLLVVLAVGLPVLQSQQQQSGQRPQEAAPDQTKSTRDQDLDIDDQVIRDVFDPLQRGVQELNLNKVLSVFDTDEMPDYATLRDQLRAFFNRYESINFRYQLLQVTSDKDRAYAVAEVDMDAMPADEALMTQRQSVQMRFQMKLGPHGWKITGFKPSDFFAQ